MQPGRKIVFMSPSANCGVFHGERLRTVTRRRNGKLDQCQKIPRSRSAVSAASAGKDEIVGDAPGL